MFIRFFLFIVLASPSVFSSSGWTAEQRPTVLLSTALDLDERKEAVPDFNNVIADASLWTPQEMALGLKIVRDELENTRVAALYRRLYELGRSLQNLENLKATDRIGYEGLKDEEARMNREFPEIYAALGNQVAIPPHLVSRVLGTAERGHFFWNLVLNSPIVLHLDKSALRTLLDQHKRTLTQEEWTEVLRGPNRFILAPMIWKVVLHEAFEQADLLNLDAYFYRERGWLGSRKTQQGEYESGDPVLAEIVRLLIREKPFQDQLEEMLHDPDARYLIVVLQAMEGFEVQKRPDLLSRILKKLKAIPVHLWKAPHYYLTAQLFSQHLVRNRFFFDRTEWLSLFLEMLELGFQNGRIVVLHEFMYPFLEDPTSADLPALIEFKARSEIRDYPDFEAKGFGRTFRELSLPHWRQHPALKKLVGPSDEVTVTTVVEAVRSGRSLLESQTEFQQEPLRTLCARVLNILNQR